MILARDTRPGSYYRRTRGQAPGDYYTRHRQSVRALVKRLRGKWNNNTATTRDVSNLRRLESSSGMVAMVRHSRGVDPFTGNPFTVRQLVVIPGDTKLRQLKRKPKLPTPNPPQDISYTIQDIPGELRGPLERMGPRAKRIGKRREGYITPQEAQRLTAAGLARIEARGWIGPTSKGLELLEQVVPPEKMLDPSAQLELFVMMKAHLSEMSETELRQWAARAWTQEQRQLAQLLEAVDQQYLDHRDLDAELAVQEELEQTARKRRRAPRGTQLALFNRPRRRL